MPRVVERPLQTEPAFGAANVLDDGSFGPGFETAPSIALDDDAIESTAANARALPARPMEAARTWPTGVSPESASIDLDPSEVALTAEYPDPPATPFAALPYAINVLLRKRALGATVSRLNGTLLEAERRRDALLVSMIEERRPELERAPDGRKLLEFVTRIETLAEEKRNALSGLSEEVRRLSAELDAEATTVAKARKESARGVEIAKAVLDERVTRHDRADARMKRLYIEVRAILDAVEKAGGEATPAQNAELTAREAEVAAHRPGLERALGELEEAKAALETKEAADEDVARRMRDVERRRTALATEAQKRLGAQTHSVTEAEAHRAEAMIEAARGVLAAKGRVVDVPATTLEAIAAADADVESCARELERYVRALDAYDADAMKNGVVTALALAAIVVLTVVWLLAR